MKPSPLARMIVAGFIGIFAFAAAYLLLDAFGIWSRLPTRLTHGAEVLTGLILVLALLAHLVLATGELPVESTDAERAP